MDKITFLGTGGGRFVLCTQARSTGGIVVEMDGIKFHIDPGPSALMKAKEYDMNLKDIDVLMLSHVHLDHTGDANAVIETLTGGTKEQRGILIASESAVDGVNGEYPAISKYHLKILERVIRLKAGEETDACNIKVKATPTEHTDKTCIGFTIRGSKRISYVSDSGYFKNLHKYHAGADVLILNVLRPLGDTWPFHMNTEGAIKLISEVKPKITVLQHFGIRMLKSDPSKQARIAEKETGYRVIAAEDGMSIKLNGEYIESLQRFVK